MLVIGFIIGLWHAFDLDHIGAMITFVADRDSSPRQAVTYGLLWATGHASMLIFVMLLIMNFHFEVSREIGSVMEFLIGALLVVLALDMLRRMRSMKLHSHHHHHKDISFHEHFHVHFRSEPHRHESHMHSPADMHGYHLRALLVGLMHGMAGSAAVMLLVVSTAASTAVGILYVMFFSLGAMAGMATLSLFISMQLRRSTRYSPALAARVRGCAAVVVFAIGVFLLSSSNIEPGELRELAPELSTWH